MARSFSTREEKSNRGKLFDRFRRFDRSVKTRSVELHNPRTPTVATRNQNRRDDLMLCNPAQTLWLRLDLLERVMSMQSSVEYGAVCSSHGKSLAARGWAFPHVRPPPGKGGAEK